MAQVLVSVEHADGEAAIVRDRRGLWLAGYAEQPSILIGDDRPRSEGLHGDRTAQGGRLPPGATGAEVVDDAGARHAAAAANGAWVVVVDQGVADNPVRYLDAAGATVCAPAPPGSRTPVPDAPEPCPACDATGWDHIVPDDFGGTERPGDGPCRPSALVVCRTCGHCETAGAFSELRPPGGAPPWPD